MKSMTGYAKAKMNQNNIDLEIEIKSVNGRYLDLRLFLPRELSFFEYTIRKRISTLFSRGTIELRINFTDHRDPRLQLNKQKLLTYYNIVADARDSLELKDNISLEFLLNEPGVIENMNNLDEDEELNNLLNNALDQVIQAYDQSLQVEADNIRITLLSSMEQIKQILQMVEQEIKPYKQELFENMKQRVNDILPLNTSENIEQRLIQEMAIYIDKYDVHEEITRLQSHISTLLNTLERSEDIGKSLNFILQEMQREANTLGSKFSTAKTFANILVLKEEIEKCREIVQNVA